MPVRRPGNKLERWEIALIKAMMADGRWPTDQDILAYFTRPTRSVNHRAVGEIRNEKKHAIIKAASPEQLENFIASWPEVDVETGLSLRGDELLIKAREAMIAAVQTFNGAGLTFRAELFIVTAIIAWTYLLHAWFKREGVDYRYIKNENGQKTVLKTPCGAEKYWDLSQSLKHARCPVEKGTRDNLTFLIGLRHEIEHRSTTRIDDAISAKLQACCINFNDAIKALFGAQYALERRLPIALQFVTFSPDQRAILKKATNLPRHVETMMDAFERELTPEQQVDPRFAFRVYMFHKTVNRAQNADLAVELVPPDSDIAEKFNLILKEVEKRKYLPSEIVSMVKAEGWDLFTMDSHTKLWKNLGAKDPAKGYGAVAVGKVWCWYDSWLTRVREECQKHPERYRSKKTTTPTT
ncbi:MAG: DUF3644 domain-containing protein [Roseomonas sp.]|nr:DUF3644 domain-containing protein [Roseomonas sp.]MCA3329027.1 DUF3644 domain-containing protein [Roseomonas sp.]MCA3330211.1 DUF3644 domain-containing protein [Roseomonas sp.]MCA3333873.1 DUF3644 domain-containing protein [Roseomonas sp.]MCA3347879.1 DUF3644 domain-containing protein [Roseomonas sp.]